MPMRKMYSGALFMCLFSIMPAQKVLWQKDIKSSAQDFLSQVISTIDQQYLITGSSIQNNKMEPGAKKQNNGYDFHLVKLDQRGNEIWEKYFAGMGHDYITTAVATQEGGFVMAGTSYSGKGLDKKEDSKGGSDIWLIKINELGEEQWQKTIGTFKNEEAKGVVQTTDLGYLVAGSSQNLAGGASSKDVLIIKLDKDGKTISETGLSGISLDEIEKLIPTVDGGALLGIYSRSGNSINNVFNNVSNRNSPKAPTPSSVNVSFKQSENYGEGDYWIVKLSKEGKIEWEKDFGGTGDDHVKSLSLTSSGYIIGGESRSDRSGNKTEGIEEGTDIWLIALNERGEEQWQKSYNFKNRDVLMGMSTINSADDKVSKGILLGGYTQAEGRIEADDETFWMLYLDQNGNEEWRKHVKGENKKKKERLSDIRLSRDGSIILAGTSAEELGKENWKIVKLGDEKIDQLIEKQDIKIYPNPVSDYTYVEIGYEFKEADILLYDMSGKLLQQTKTKNKVTKINTQPLIQGAYLVTITTDTQKTANAKLIKK